jgi:two-component system, NarL family, nitrate/nitrite response regulator NarL
MSHFSATGLAIGCADADDAAVTPARTHAAPLPLRILIADDRPVNRADLRRHLRAGGVSVCAEASDGASAAARAVTDRPDLCVLAVRPAMDAVATAEAIVHAAPAVCVVLLGPVPDDEDLVAAVRAGADGYLTDDLGPRLVPALLDVAAGRPAFPARLNALLVERLRGGPIDRSAAG